MHDQVLVCVAHGCADFPEEAQTLANRQLTRLAVHIDGLSRDQLHHHIRQSILRCRAVYQPRDIGMIQVREDLTLGPEALHDEFGVESAAHELDRNFLFIVRVRTARSIDLPHSTAPQQLDELIRAHSPPEPTVLIRIAEALGEIVRRKPIDEGIRRAVRSQQRLGLAAQIRIPRARLIEITQPRCRLELTGPREDLLYPLPPFRGHWPRSGPRTKCARAVCI